MLYTSTSPVTVSAPKEHPKLAVRLTMVATSVSGGAHIDRVGGRRDSRWLVD
jgi:hypothetical protein